MGNHQPCPLELDAVQCRRHAGEPWVTMPMQGDFRDDWSRLPGKLLDGHLALASSPDGRPLSYTMSVLTRGTATIDLKDQTYKSPRSGPQPVQSFTVRLRKGITDKDVTKLGYKPDVFSELTLEPTFAGGQRLSVRIYPGWQLAVKGTLTVQVPGGGPKSWSNYPSLLHSVESIAGHQAQTHWPSYDGLGRSALERTLALDGCVPMDRESLNHFQNTELAVWTPILQEIPRIRCPSTYLVGKVNGQPTQSSRSRPR